MECGEQSVTMAGMKEMQLLSVSSWGLDNQVSKLLTVTMNKTLKYVVSGMTIYYAQLYAANYA